MRPVDLCVIGNRNGRTTASEIQRSTQIEIIVDLQRAASQPILAAFGHSYRTDNNIAPALNQAAGERVAQLECRYVDGPRPDYRRTVVVNICRIRQSRKQACRPVARNEPISLGGWIMLPVGVIRLDGNCRTNKNQQTNATEPRYILHFEPLPPHTKRNFANCLEKLSKQTTP